MNWLNGVDWAALTVWVPTIAVVLLAVVACLGAALLPERAAYRRYGSLFMAACGVAAIAATVWSEQRETRQVADQGIWAQQRVDQGASAHEDYVAGLTRRLHATWTAFDDAAKPLPPTPDADPPKSFDTPDAAFTALAAEADALGARIKAFQAGMQPRRIDEATAAAMVAYLKPLAHGRVVVSCIPQDDEAYLYSNRIATILRGAGWDASGPEFTAIFGTTPALGINLYVRGGEPPDAAKVLTDAFTKFNIPYKAQITPNDAIPDTETVELFVSKKP
ncbi:MAG TPA: hypothetical protein VGG57_22965 [Stellaceae bacterium]|jgi:hypothetical protein